jgi:branched-chain amino acid transport system ATP-binding protein
LVPEPQCQPADAKGPGETVLSVKDVKASYGKRQVLHDVSLDIKRGEVVALLGHNGAGKTTLLKAVFGLLRPTAGSVQFQGAICSSRPYYANVEAGMSFTPSEAAVFRDLSVMENLELGGFTVRSAAERRARIPKIFEIFPVLSERTTQLAGTLSGGEQRMLSMGIALMSGPSLMLLDEPSLGLTPALAQRVLDMVRNLADREGMSVLVIEQNVRAALRVATRAYFIRSGRIILEEPADVALARGKWWDLF